MELVESLEGDEETSMEVFYCLRVTLRNFKKLIEKKLKILNLNFKFKMTVETKYLIIDFK